MNFSLRRPAVEQAAHRKFVSGRRAAVAVGQGFQFVIRGAGGSAVLKGE